MADPNKNSFLSTFRDEYIDPYPLTADLFATFDKLSEYGQSGNKASYIRDNVANMGLEELLKQRELLETDLKHVYDYEELVMKVDNRINFLNGNYAKTDTPDVVLASSPDNLESKKDNTYTTSKIEQFAPDNPIYDNDTEYQKKITQQELEVSTPEIEQKSNKAADDFINKTGEFNVTGNAETKELAAQFNLTKDRNEALQQFSNTKFDLLKNTEGSMSQEEKKNRVAALTEELKEAIGYDDKIDKNLLLLKFGTDLLRARTDRTKKLPATLDLLAQAFAPTANYLFQQKAENQKNLKEIGLTAFTLVKDEEEALKKEFEADPRYASAVMTIDYDENGKKTGEKSYFKNILSPAEATFYSNFVYPAEINGQAVPEELVGKQVFMLAQPGTSADPVYTTGLFGSDPNQIFKVQEKLGFMEQALNNTKYVLDIYKKFQEKGIDIYGINYGPIAFRKLITQGIDEASSTFPKLFGTGDRAEKIKNMLQGKTTLEKQSIIMDELGIDADVNGLVNETNNMKNAILKDIANSGMSEEVIAAETAKVMEYYADFQTNILNDPDIDIIKILETTQTFAFARYLQGSNRLLKDVIAKSEDIVRLGGFWNTNEKVKNKYMKFLRYFADEYNRELSLIEKPGTEAYNNSMIRLTPDGMSFMGGWRPSMAEGSNYAQSYANQSLNSEKVDMFEGFLPKDVIDELRSAN